MKTHLSLAKDYSPDWGLWEGVRELVQNWMDAFEDGDTISHEGTTLTLENQGARLVQKNIAVMGSSDKTGDAAMRGQFGDGLKVGCLGLVRAGYVVRFRSADIFYTASIEQSKEHGAEVLTFRSRKGGDPDAGVRFQLEGITAPQWADLKGRFLFDSRGPLLQDKPGRLFARDIWICDRDGLEFGYNFSKARVGRDRDMMSDWDVRYSACQIVAEAFKAGEISAQRLVGLLADGAEDVEHISIFLNTADKDALRRAFAEIHGEKAVPVCTTKQSERAQHLGMKPVIVYRGLLIAAPEIAGERLNGDAIVREVKPTELSEDEYDNLNAGIRMLGGEFSAWFDGLTIRIVQFAEESLLGTREGSEINIAHHVLADRWKTLQTLVEETAHSAGADGTFEHKWRIHEIYTDILKKVKSL